MNWISPYEIPGYRFIRNVSFVRIPKYDPPNPKALTPEGRRMIDLPPHA